MSTFLSVVIRFLSVQAHSLKKQIQKRYSNSNIMTNNPKISELLIITRSTTCMLMLTKNYTVYNCYLPGIPKTYPVLYAVGGI